jgi:hypothetical protein
LNDDGERTEKNQTNFDDIVDNEDREDELLASIDADKEENYIPADEKDTTIKEIPDYYVRTKKAPRGTTPAVEDDLFAVMSSDDPRLEEYYYADYYYDEHKNEVDNPVFNPSNREYQKGHTRSGGNGKSASASSPAFYQETKEKEREQTTGKASSRDFRHRQGKTIYNEGRKNLKNRIERQYIKRQLKEIKKAA